MGGKRRKRDSEDRIACMRVCASCTCALVFFFHFASSGFVARDDVVFVSCVILWEKAVLLLLCFIDFFLWRLGNIFLRV